MLFAIVIFLVVDDLVIFIVIDRLFPAWRERWRELIPLFVVGTLAAIGIAWLILKALMAKPTTGREGLLGEEGVAMSDIAPEGRVFVHGEIWTARSKVRIGSGEPVIVVAIDGLKLMVERSPQPLSR